ncbi:MAG: hypothetical protein UX02_C0001G0065 [Candidatus Moranbacteria bacterium GW2011_GWC1_45_18]|nr:MAG: hypothetical protein UT79_C0002G0332 [Candidatus Moranbacteria bacterium GW2011_GWC2_40_12]KKT34171.1 MAG: hypothetical protein UW19_C0001G0066 [Candidatus Moranbacteria bacterium GW2011_GWF2_44_10]KKU00617.1 MAG: hypothetical protein UX02_C0001G0065 [Candidatus Moranbacteria bacterium GW2011_GWC1_45_18]OGI24064.1 MAG: hypothetical protein A2194_02085 [Candidatus Moranbacteria bacterium RIFOXYA1_FULL_44_8]OGI34887.1 MAG: hypothetical protein A2407_03470 [Candidatus Moranbacteria bacteri
MGAENKIKSEKISRVNRAFQRGFSFFLRWFYLLIIVIASAYAVLIWKKYILNAEWSEEKKKAYISEQSVLQFDEEKYKKALEIMNSRREKLKNGKKYFGRDIFFPE